jgi:hypothetical protein
MPPSSPPLPCSRPWNRNIHHNIRATVPLRDLCPDHTQHLQLIGACLLDSGEDAEGRAEISGDSVVQHGEFPICTEV